MNQISAAVTVALALMTFTLPKANAVLNCYTCTGALTTEEGRRCADLSNIATTDVGQGSCFVKTVVIDNIPVITRNGTFAPSTVTVVPVCEPVIVGLPITEIGTECSCTTEKCNDAKVKIPYLSCYECTTMGMLSGACGKGTEFNGGSLYVQQTPGCHACVKHEGHDGSVTRSCSRNLYSINRCDDGDRGRTCYCTDSLCNTSAHTTASILATVILVSLTRWLL